MCHSNAEAECKPFFYDISKAISIKGSLEELGIMNNEEFNTWHDKSQLRA